MQLDAAAPIVTAAATDVAADENTPMTLSVDVALAADATDATVI